jgi:energy-coupling factor transporter ATP-binding protein EcfA2
VRKEKEAILNKTRQEIGMVFQNLAKKLSSDRIDEEEKQVLVNEIKYRLSSKETLLKK